MTYITDALKPLVAERERYARMVDQLDRAIASVEKLGREGRLTIVPDEHGEPVKPYPCTHEGCSHAFSTPSILAGHAYAHQLEDRRKQRDAEDLARAAENAKKRADEADRRVEGPVFCSDPSSGSAYIPPEFDPPLTSGPPAHSGMVPTGLPKRPLDHNKIRAAAWTDPEDEVKNV